MLPYDLQRFLSIYFYEINSRFKYIEILLLLFQFARFVYNTTTKKCYIVYATIFITRISWN